MDVEANRAKTAEQEKDGFLLDEDVTSLGGNASRKDYSGTSPWSLRSRSAIATTFSVFFMLAVALFMIFLRNTEGEGVCPGNLVLMDCPCFIPCNSPSDEALVDRCPTVGECSMGCGCPKDAPFLVGPERCANSCLETASLKQRDATDCPAVKTAPLEPTEVLHYDADSTETFHFRVSPTMTCASVPGTRKHVDVLLHFTLVVKNADCAHKIPEYFVSYALRQHIALATAVGCLSMNTPEYDESIRGAWFFYVARLTNLVEDSEVDYQVGFRSTVAGKKASSETSKVSPTRKLVAPLAPGSNHLERPILVLGDTATLGAKVVAVSAMRVAKKTGYYSLAIHVGDASYATNKGDCYDDKGLDPSNRCGYECKGIACHGADKLQNQEMLDLYTWARVIDASLGGHTTWVSTMGNHDNDLGWFLTYRPPLIGAVPGVHQRYLSWRLKDERFLIPAESNAQKQADAMDYMKSPHFYSFDHGLMHVIQIGTEDNPVNAYETWNGQPLSAALKKRFDEHYGKSSKQYNWLVEDLKRASRRRSLVPWIAIYTHRPMFHTAQHHEWCAKGGDWYACLFVDTYEPLLREYGVNLFITGHSHHYQRSFPMHKQHVRPDGTIHLIVGVGGYDVVGEQWVKSPEWMAARQGTTLGYARFWVKNSTSIYWEHLAASDDSLLDSAWFHNVHVPT